MQTENGPSLSSCQRGYRDGKLPTLGARRTHSQFQSLSTHEPANSIYVQLRINVDPRIFLRSELVNVSICRPLSHSHKIMSATVQPPASANFQPSMSDRLRAFLLALLLQLLLLFLTDDLVYFKP